MYVRSVALQPSWKSLLLVLFAKISSPASLVFELLPGQLPMLSGTDKTKIFNLVQGFNVVYMLCKNVFFMGLNMFPIYAHGLEKRVVSL